MQSKSYVRGKLCVVETLPQPKISENGGNSIANSGIEISSVLDNPYHTWLRSQAQSIIGKPVTLKDAELLWTYVNINTREPFDAPQPSALSRFLRALRAAVGMDKESAKESQ